VEGRTRRHAQRFQRAFEESERHGVRAGRRLFAVSAESLQVVAYDETGKPRVVADGIAGNDIAVRCDGSLYVTAPGNSNPAPTSCGWSHGRFEDGRGLRAEVPETA